MSADALYISCQCTSIIFSNIVYFLLGDGSSSNNNIIIGGSMGAVILLLMIIIALCTVMLFMRCNKEGASLAEDKVFNNTTNLNTNVTIINNPSYEVTKANAPYKKPGESNAAITINPSYSVPAKPYSKTSEDEYNYVQPSELNQHSGLEGIIKINVNPSYGVSKPYGTQPSNEGEYGVVNQPKCNDTDYEITHNNHYQSTAN